MPKRSSAFLSSTAIAGGIEPWDRPKRVLASANEQADNQPDVDNQRHALLAEQRAISARLRQAYKLLGRSGSEVEIEMEADQQRLDEVKTQLSQISAETFSGRGGN